MTEIDFTVKEIAKQLDCSTQYIYSILPQLVEQGLAYKDNEKHSKITVNGLNYLREKRTSNLQQLNNRTILQEEEKVENKEEEDFATIMQLNPYKILYEETLKRCEEQKKEIEYWKEMYIEKDKTLTSITSQFLLTDKTEEQKEKKKGFFKRIFK